MCGGFTGHRWIPLTQRPVAQSFEVFFDLCLNKSLSRPSGRRLFETLSRPFWRHCNEIRLWKNRSDSDLTLVYTLHVRGIIKIIVPVLYYKKCRWKCPYFVIKNSSRKVWLCRCYLPLILKIRLKPTPLLTPEVFNTYINTIGINKIKVFSVD